jgi:hypothetical protein
MEELKTYTKHFHLRYGWRREKHIPNIVIGDMDGGKKNIYQTLSFEIWMEVRKTYTKTMFGICFALLHPYLK